MSVTRLDAIIIFYNYLFIYYSIAETMGVMGHGDLYPWTLVHRVKKNK